MAHSSKNPTIIFTPASHNMKLRPRTPVDYTYRSSNAADRSPSDIGSCGGLLTGRAPLRTVNSALADFGANAARKLRTVKRAWGNFKAKMKPRGNAKRQRLWTVSSVPLVTSPSDPSAGRYRAVNSPLSPSIYQTPNSRASSIYQTPNSLSYRHLIASTPDTPDTITFGTPQTDMTPLNLTMVSVSSTGSISKRRSQRIASSTPQQGTAKKRTTPKRGKKATRSPGRFLQDLSTVTNQMSNLAQSMQAFQTMEKGFSKTIEKQDSNSTLSEIPIQQTSEEDNRFGVRASQRISKSRLKQLEENMQTDDSEGDKTPKAPVGLAIDVEQERLV
ncbi:uncharacterized protein [Amphiura filiformis]|uniref:uncharacterized protein n=1 Tax=Amphiura filiformis TaxID=82378 RepID=UPI003B223CA9